MFASGIAVDTECLNTYQVSISRIQCSWEVLEVNIISR